MGTTFCPGMCRSSIPCSANTSSVRDCGPPVLPTLPAPLTLYGLMPCSSGVVPKFESSILFPTLSCALSYLLRALAAVLKLVSYARCCLVVRRSSAPGFCSHALGATSDASSCSPNPILLSPRASKIALRLARSTRGRSFLYLSCHARILLSTMVFSEGFEASTLSTFSCNAALFIVKSPTVIGCFPGTST